MGEITKFLDSKYSKRMRRMSAIVDSVPRSVNGKTLGYVLATVADQSGIKVYTGINDVYYPGDQVTIEQSANTAAAVYTVVGANAMSRPNSGVYEFSGSASVASAVYQAGDLVLGDIVSGGNVFVDESTGILFHRIGASVFGVEYPGGSQLFGHAIGSGSTWTASGPNVLISDTGIRLRQGVQNKVLIDQAGVIIGDDYDNFMRISSSAISITTSELDERLRIDSTNGISMYANGGQRAAIRPNGSGWLAGADKLAWDTSGNLTLAGTINAGAGNITGLLQVGTGTPHIHIDGTNSLIESSNFASGTAGWRIASDGSAEFENITARGAIRTAVFEKSLVTAFAGSQVISKSAAVLAANVTLSGTTFTVTVKLQAGSAPFANGDLIYIKTIALATYATVNAGSASGDNWSYTATYKSGDASGTINAGETVLDYGPDGTGRLVLTADQTNAPYLSIATHNMDAAPVWTERVRLGNLTGISGATGYGLWSDNVFLKGTLKTSLDELLLPSGCAAYDINNNSTTISGGKITTGTITATQIAAGTITADKLLVTTGGGNVLLNSSFEDITSSSNTYWTRYDNGAEATSYGFVTTAPYWGSRHYQISWTNSTNTKGIYSSGNNVGKSRANRTYSLSFWARTASALSTPCGMTLAFNTAPTLTAVVNPNLSTTWQRYVFKLAWGATVDNNNFFINLGNHVQNANSLYIDNIMYQEGDVASGWTPAPEEVLPGTIVADMVAAGAITAGKINVSTLSAISASMGSITSGSITGGVIRSANSGARVEINDTKIFGTNGTTEQWYALASDGKIYAGGGAVTLDQYGVSIDSGNGVMNRLNYKSGANYTALIGCTNISNQPTTLSIDGYSISGGNNGTMLYFSSHNNDDSGNATFTLFSKSNSYSKTTAIINAEVTSVAGLLVIGSASPTGTQAGLYIDAGNLKYRFSNGAVTTLATDD